MNTPAAALRILLLTHSFNSLTQRLFVELRARGHTLSVELDIADAVTEEAVALFQPDLVIAPFLKRRIPESVWRGRVCWVVHPGIEGDRGPSALDRAILRGEATWGVTVLQATAEFDAGPVWASVPFVMRAASKSSLYRREVTQAAVDAVFVALARFMAGDGPAPSVASSEGRGWPLLRRDERRIDWSHDDTATVLCKLRAGDGSPGTADGLFGTPCHLFDAHAATSGCVQALPAASPGEVMARRGPALLRRTADGAVWLGHVRTAPETDGLPAIKLPATQVFATESVDLPELAVALDRVDAEEWDELHYAEVGAVGACVGLLRFEFHNGAMSATQCERLRDALRHARSRDTQVLVLLGGADHFCNGIHLNAIEAAAQRADDSAADASWRNIQAMNGVVLEILTMTDRVTVSALRGGAGAGGVFLALAADEVWAYSGVVLNPHYKNMGNLYGSEYWTYVLPRRVGAERAKAITQGRLPVGVPQALALGLVDASFGADADDFLRETMARALAVAQHNGDERLAAKRKQRADDEAARPLAAYRDTELAQMHRNFYGFDPSYHVARYHFVRKLEAAWTPRHLAVHRGGV
jgi:putative two-component system hydrogenase maturation factor HypX/HoxX